MNRRSFLKSSLTVSAGLALGATPRLNRFASADDPTKWRSFEVITKVDVIKPVGATRVWLPIPLTKDTDYFKRENDNWTGNFKAARIIHHDRYGTGLLFAEWPAGETAPALELKSRFMTRDRQVNLSEKPNQSVKEDRAVLDYFRKPSKLIRTDGIVGTTSRGITMGTKSDVDKARAIYEWIVDNTFRDPKVKGCGIGDISTMLQTGYLGGKCADLNALYVGLARAAGLPARDVYGIRVAPSELGYKSLGTASANVTKSQHC